MINFRTIVRLLNLISAKSQADFVCLFVFHTKGLESLIGLTQKQRMLNFGVITTTSSFSNLRLHKMMA
jgi:hypothetical protein